MTHHRSALVVSLLVLVGSIAGCLADPERPEPTPDSSALGSPEEDLSDSKGPEPEPREPSGGEARASKEKGSVQGRVLDAGMDPVPNATVTLTTEAGEEVVETRVDAEGYYVINDVEPGEYRLFVYASCCKQAARAIEVKAGEIIESEFILEPLSDRELRRAIKEGPLQWHGFLPCSVGAGGVSTPPCASDPNNDHIHSLAIQPDLKSVVMVMEWESIVELGLEDMRLRVSHEAPQYIYASFEGPSPLVARLDAGEGDHGQRDFDALDEEWEMRFVVNAAGSGNVAFQREFVVHYSLFYGEHAPDDYDPRADG